MKNRALTVAAGASLGLAIALRSTSRIPVFDAFDEAGAPWLLTSLPPWWWLVLAAGAGAGLGYWLPRRAAPPFLFAGLAASAVFVPKAFEIAPFLAAFSGRMLDFVLVCAALVVGWRLAPASPRLSAKRVSAVAACVFVAVGLKMSRDVGLSGDEPHYLLITHSILEDGDLQVVNNYLEEDYRQFYLGKIGPHLAADTPYSVHGVGLPVLLVPGYALAGVNGVVVTLALLGAVVVGGIFRAGRLIGLSDEAAALAALAFGLTSPGLFLCAAAYPELPAAVTVMLVTLVLVRPTPVGRFHAVGVSLAVGALPFFHVKFLPLAGVLWLVLAHRLRTAGARIAVAAGAAASALVLMAFFYNTTGSLDPTSSYGRQRIFVSGIPRGLLGLFFDQEYGLLVFAPVYLAGIVGCVALLRRRPTLALSAVAVLAAVALPGAAHPLWSGGNSPPARFLFPALPLVALAVGCSWSWEKRSPVARWLPVLVALSLAVAAFTVFLPGQPLYLNARDGTGRLWEALSSSWDITPYLPSIVRGDTRSLVWAWTGAGAVAAALVLHYFRRMPKLPPFVVLALAAAWAQDLTGVEQTRAQEGRWITGFMGDIAARQPDRFLAVPSFERLETAAALARAPLRLAPLRPDGDATAWWSRAYAIPAGRYRVAGVARESWAPCNERSCFRADGARFDSAVALARFQARARRFDDPPPRLYFERVRGDAPIALRSMAVAGRRLHGLDDEAYLDPKGFWVKRGARASFALEPGGELTLANGGLDNSVVVHTASGEERFELAPWARATFAVASDGGAARFAVESEGGFRPIDLDPASADYRELGVFVTVQAFDLGR